MSDPVAVVRAYFDAVAAADVEAVGSLFAPDAELYSAAGILRGAEAITKMYANGLPSGNMKPRPGPLLVDGERVAVEIELGTNGRVLTLGDFFTVRQGKIHRLAIYSLTPPDPEFFNDGGDAPA